MPKTAQKLFDQALRRQIHTNRFSDRLGRDVVKTLRESEKRITEKLATSGELTSFGRKRFENMLLAIRGINKEAYDTVGKTLNKEFRGLVKDELRFQTKSIQNAYSLKLQLDRPSTNQVVAAVASKPFQGAVLKDWVNQLDSSSIRKIEGAIKIGFIEGETIGQVTRRLKDVYPTNRRGLEALVRTATTHTATLSRENIYKANEDLFKGVKWVSTLDGRTTPICQRRDGKVFKLEEGPRPPAHWACRSTTVPVTKSWKELGFDDLAENDSLSKRPFVADKRKVSDIPKGQRNIGVTAADETYPKWLKRQSDKFQDDVLGKTRGKLFREDKISIKGFSDRTGKLYTLDELRDREDLTLEDINKGVAVNDLEFVVAKQAQGEVLVKISASALDKAWKKDTGSYISRGSKEGSENVIGRRLEQFEKFLIDNPDTPIEAPEVFYRERQNLIVFGNGRHRFSVLRDMGIRKMVVSVPPENLLAIQKRLKAVVE